MSTSLDRLVSTLNAISDGLFTLRTRRGSVELIGRGSCRPDVVVGFDEIRLEEPSGDSLSSAVHALLETVQDFVLEVTASPGWPVSEGRAADDVAVDRVADRVHAGYVDSRGWVWHVELSVNGFQSN